MTLPAKECKELHEVCVKLKALKKEYGCPKRAHDSKLFYRALSKQIHRFVNAKIPGTTKAAEYQKIHHLMLEKAFLYGYIRGYEKGGEQNVGSKD
jgi:hypothetical protein